MANKIWTYREASIALPKIILITEQTYKDYIEFNHDLKHRIWPENVQEEKEELIQILLADWEQSVEKIGAEVKGLWLVDFDNGKGYFCWKLGEDTLLFEHGYNEGFSGRKPISKKIEDSGI